MIARGGKAGKSREEGEKRGRVGAWERGGKGRERGGERKSALTNKRGKQFENETQNSKLHARQ
jgi:hypothetical protein